LRWPAVVREGVSDALVCLMDLRASFGSLVGRRCAETGDGEDVLNALLGRSRTGRARLVEHAGCLGLLEGALKVIEASAGPAYDPYTDTELGNAAAPQLYDLAVDLGERTDLAESRPQTVSELLRRLAQATR
jgi:hypothetical protein